MTRRVERVVLSVAAGLIVSAVAAAEAWGERQTPPSAGTQTSAGPYVPRQNQPNRPADGMIGVQVHVGPPMKVEYRNIRLKNW